MDITTTIDPSVLAGIDADIAGQQAAGEYRPTVVVILTDRFGQVLLVQSTKSRAHWGFPQGGVDPGESVLAAIERELYEEIRVCGADVAITGYYGSNQIEIPDWERREDYQKGKRYYYFLAVWKHAGWIDINREELTAHRWVLPGAVEENLSTVNEQKRQTLLNALRSAVV